jgi:hypothetical protein
VHLPPSLHLDIALVRILGRKSQSKCSTLTMQNFYSGLARICTLVGSVITSQTRSQNSFPVRLTYPLYRKRPCTPPRQSGDFHRRYQCKERKAHSVKYKFELRTQKEERAYPEHRHRDLLEDRSQKDQAEEDEQMNHES